MTGPLAPAAASWIWDAVGVMPLTVTSALTERSAVIVITAIPLAAVVTGGTSLLPDRSSRCSIDGDIDCDWQPASIASAPAITAPDHTHVCIFVFIMFPPLENSSQRLPRHGRYD